MGCNGSIIKAFLFQIPVTFFLKNLRSISGKCRSLYYQWRVVFYSISFTQKEKHCQCFQTNMAAMTELEEFVDIDHDTEFLTTDVADILEHVQEGFEVIVEEDDLNGYDFSELYCGDDALVK